MQVSVWMHRDGVGNNYESFTSSFIEVYELFCNGFINVFIIVIIERSSCVLILAC